MKKIILTLFVVLFSVLSANATTYSPENRIDTVGSTILTKNALPTVKFAIVEAEPDNSNVTTTKLVNIAKTDLKYTGNDNEVAAVVAEELGAIVNAAASKKDFANTISNSILGNITDEKLLNVANVTQQLSMMNLSSKEQMNADITGVDLMINAGYNPLAMIVVLGKMEGSLSDTLQMQPANLKRTMNIYDYLSYNYPDKVKAGYACNEYRNFVAYIQPTIDKRNNNKKELAKFEKAQAKAKNERAKQLLKYKVTGGANAWDITKTLLENKDSNS